MESGNRTQVCRSQGGRFTTQANEAMADYKDASATHVDPTQTGLCYLLNKKKITTTTDKQ